MTTEPEAGSTELATTALSASKRALAARRLQKRVPTRATRDELADLTLATSDGRARLSLAQEQLWYFHRLAPDNPVYNEAVTFEKLGKFDHSAFVSAFNEVVRRNEAWRTTFALVDGVPMQIVHEHDAIDIPLVDLSHLEPDVALLEAQSLAAAAASAPYDLASGPLVRPHLFCLDPSHHRLALALHHMVFDGVTLYRIVMPELVALYEGLLSGRPLPSQPRRVPYRAYAEWERRWLAVPAGQARIAHWQTRLADVAALELPLDRPRPPAQRFRGFMEAFELPADVGAGLRELAESLGATLFQVLAAVFAVLLHGYGGQDEVVFATASDLRQRPELQGVAGYCVTSLVLACAVGDADSFSTVVARLRAELADAFGNILPFPEVVRALAPARDLKANPLFQALFTLEPAMVTADPEWSVHQIEAAVGNAIGHAKFDLTMELDERPEGHIAGRLILNEDVFAPASAQRIVEHFTTLVGACLASPLLAVGELAVISPTELAWLDERSGTARPVAPVSLVEMVTDALRVTPEAVAFQCDAETLTRGDLDDASGRVASRLLCAGAGGGDVVGVFCDRRLELPAGLLGVLKAGGAYLPLVVGTPASRLAFMIRDAGARLVAVPQRLVSSKEFGDLVSALPDGHVSIVAYELAGHESSGLAAAPRRPVSPADPAYVMYTSGSTGQPKGVSITHGAVVNLLASLAIEPGLSTGDTAVALASFGFDMSTPEWLLPLVVGARTVIAPEGTVIDPHRLATLLERAGATFMQATPTTWQMLIDSGWQGKPDLVAVSGAEPLRAELAELLLERSAGLWNAYGPTETTVWSTITRLWPGDAVTIGRPIANTHVEVVNRCGRLVPVGSRGELCIGGAGLAIGYVNRPEESEARFGVGNDGRRIYRTGDLARWLPDGRLQHLGRVDDQVKVRGHRIEPAEIEAALCQLLSVSAAAVVSHASPAATRLVAFLRPAPGATPSDPELRRSLRTWLPEYMIPSRFVTLSEFPQTANGKLDRAELCRRAEGALADRATGSGALDRRATPRLAPASARTALEHQLSRIWEGVLGAGEVGLDEDFFDLGGHSMLGVSLLYQVERSLGVDLPVSVIYERGATVRGMASAIEALATGGSPSVGQKTPVFFVMPSDTSFVSLRHLGPALGPAREVMGVLAARDGEQLDRGYSIEQRASDLLDQVTGLQPTGPYYLAGYSLGGVLAYEIAGQLLARGETVAWLGLVNTRSPATIMNPPRIAAKAARLLVIDSKAAPSALRRRVMHTVIEDPYVDVGFDGEGALALGRLYQPPPLPLDLDLYVSKGDAVRFGRTLGWRRSHAGRVNVHLVPGEHRVLFDMSSAPALAEAVSATLAERDRS